MHFFVCFVGKKGPLGEQEPALLLHPEKLLESGMVCGSHIASIAPRACEVQKVLCDLEAFEPVRGILEMK